jgi:hypothetical protein
MNTPEHTPIPSVLTISEHLISPNRSGDSLTPIQPVADGGFPAPERGQIRDVGRY